MCTIDWASVAVWISAIATSLIAFLTWRTLLKLREYANDTRKIAESTKDQLEELREQAEASIRPAVVVGQSQDKAKADIYKLYATNRGNGLALNITWNRVWENGASTEVLPSLGAGMDEWFIGDVRMIQQFQKGELLLTYTSLSGQAYETLLTITNDPDSGRVQMKTNTRKSGNK